MSIITEILATDKVGDSRTDINTNFSNLNTDKLEAVTVTAGDLTGDGTAGDALVLADTTVTAGAYTLVGLTVDGKGRITQATEKSGDYVAITDVQAVDITSSTNVLTLDTDYAINYHLLTENTVLAVPSTAGWTNGDTARLDLFVKVDAGGTYAMTFNASWKFDGGTAPTLTATASAVDHLVVTVSKTAGLTIAWVGLAGADIKASA